MNCPSQDKDFSRRSGCSRRQFILTAGLASGVALTAGVPLASYVFTPALKKGTGKWFDFGAVEDLEPGNFSMLSYEFMVKDGWLVLPQRGFVWARTEDDDRIKVFSSTCTHLACNVIWQEESRTFECPCHSGRFDSSGNPVGGPPNRPMTVLESKIDASNLFVFLSF